ncbi:hypothetical protein JNJ66_06785 [Candidatus Saccharibacteria bacterium]|nr:hypothetical protein [Candidatus Saccharibacteria bacterium]
MNRERIYPDHLYEPSRVALAQQILQKELRKLFPELSPENRGQLDIAVTGWAQRPSEYHLDEMELRDFWNIFAAMMESVKLKPKFVTLLTAGNYHWRREQLVVADIGMSSPFDQLQQLPGLKARPGTTFADIGKALSDKPDLIAEHRRIVESHSTDAEQNTYPIIVREQDGRLQVMDGNRRALLAFMHGQRLIDAWVYRSDGEAPKDFWVPVNDLYQIVAMYKIAKETGRAEQDGPVLRRMLDIHFSQSAVAAISFEDRILSRDDTARELYGILPA